MTVFDALAAADRRAGALVFHRGDDAEERIGAARLLEEAELGASALAAAGIGPGDPVGVLGPNEPEWARWAFAIWRTNATLVPIQYPLRTADRTALAEQVGAMTRAAGCRIVVAHPSLLDAVPPPLAFDWSTPGTRRARTPVASRPSTPAVAQFTSGTTGAPRAALVRHHAVLEAIPATGIAFEFSHDDIVAGWQPFFHDLGLFGLLLRPLLLGMDAHLLPTGRFARDPAEWFRLVGRARASMTTGPCAGWGAALRAAMRDPDGCDLSSLRVAVLAADTIQPEVVASLVRDGASLGLAEGAIGGAYGMAETTLGITVARPGEGLRLDEVDAVELTEGRHARAPGPRRSSRLVASCGAPVPGAEVEVTGADGGPVPDRTVGSIRVRSPFTFSGYLGGPPHRPEEWIDTGDLGYLAEGELFFTAREKDVVVVMGRNHAPEDLEWAAGRVPGVRAGRVAAFATPGREEHAATVAVEPRPDADPGALARDVRRAVTDAVGVTPAEVLVLDPGTVPKTTSGKIRRGALRDAYASGNLTPVARWPSPG